ncbi:aspartyl-phosphate phosphatase Spo0E family protein [Virgibacillus halodenitrificans]|uniref:aspartyl-phosphate phosphatase Spo0E family protein n=1 Tax=Virgibacillus halodenitrificans TaxID=1482 RepID=UPI0003006463|nr:aspartyl-phosphate phosphatase Spo0E family protein [Virgibacillus halodenitrificans]
MDKKYGGNDEMVQKDPALNKLITDIIMVKHEMIMLGMQYGLNDERTVECSQQLDDLLNKHSEMTQQEACFMTM